MPAILGIIFLYVLFCLLIRYCQRNDAYALHFPQLAAAFGFKVLMACLYGYIFLHFYQGDDTWMYHQEGLNEYRLLLNDPLTWLDDWLPRSSWVKSNGVVEWFGYYLEDLEYCITRKTLGLCDIVSRGNYYVNTVFVSFVFFQGPFLLYKLVAKLVPGQRQVLFAVIFFFPPVVFWLSGIRSDGWLFLSIALALWHCYRWLHEDRKRSIVYILAGVGGVLVFRNEVALLLVPALLVWYITVRYKWKPGWVAAGVYGVVVVLMVLNLFLKGDGLVTGTLIRRQGEFMALNGNTRFALERLEPTVSSFVRVLPEAAVNSLLRPYPWEAKGALQWLSVMETIGLLFFLLAVLWRPAQNKPPFRTHPVWWVLLCFGVSLYLLTGFVVPFPGAIVRYRVIGELLLLVLLGAGWRRGRARVC